MVVCNYFAIAPTTEEIYQKYGVYTMKVRNYSALAPSTEYLRRRYMEYILWRCSNFFAIALTMEGTWSTYLWRYRNLSAIAHTTWRRPKHGGDPMLAGLLHRRDGN